MARAIDADALLEKAWDADTRVGYVQVVDVGDIEDAPTIEPAKQGWISMKDRLPEEHARVLTYSHAYGVMIGIMDCDGEFYFPYCLLPDEPSHWMPLPELPENE